MIRKWLRWEFISDEELAVKVFIAKERLGIVLEWFEFLNNLLDLNAESFPPQEVFAGQMIEDSGKSDCDVEMVSFMRSIYNNYCVVKNFPEHTLGDSHLSKLYTLKKVGFSMKLFSLSIWT